MIALRILLKSCAMPPASVPSASSFCEWRSAASSSCLSASAARRRVISRAVTWMTIPRDAYEAVGASTDDLEGIVDIPRSIEGTQVGLLFRQTQSGEVKISFRSNGPVDVNALARRFRGGGHVKAAGAIVAGPIERAMDEVIAATREAVARARSEGASA